MRAVETERVDDVGAVEREVEHVLEQRPRRAGSPKPGHTGANTW